MTIIHVVRIPVEVTLAALYEGGLIPEIMTYRGQNFDIAAELTAPLVLYFGFRPGGENRRFLIAWNVIALALWLNIVATAVLCLPSPLQRMAFDQPNVGILYFPFVWLPTVVVSIVFFCHFASLYKLVISKE